MGNYKPHSRDHTYKNKMYEKYEELDEEEKEEVDEQAPWWQDYDPNTGLFLPGIGNLDDYDF